MKDIDWLKLIEAIIITIMGLCVLILLAPIILFIAKFVLMAIFISILAFIVFIVYNLLK